MKPFQFLLWSLLLIVFGCSTVKESPPIGGLHKGVTTRYRVYATMGIPSVRMEQGGIMTYRLSYSEEQDRYVIVKRSLSGSEGAGWRYADYSLVLLFDPHGILENYTIVRVK